MKKFIDNYFKLKERNSNFIKEIIAGIIVFFAILYTIPVNTSLLSESGIGEDSAFTITVLVIAITTLLNGLITNRPFVMASGAGMNAFFVYTLTGVLKYTWAEALSIVVVSSVLFLIISLTGLRTKIVNAIPMDLKYAISASLGLFLALIGLNMGGIIISNPDTIVSLGRIDNPIVLLAFFGIFLVLILSVIPSKINRFAIIFSMFSTAALGLILGAIGVENMPSFNFDVKVNFDTTFVAFKNLSVLTEPKTYALIISALLVQLFDATGAVVAIGSDMGVIDDEGKLLDSKKIMFADSISLVIANTIGGPSSINLAESAIATKNGARTGLASVVVGLLALSSLVLFPIFSVFSTINVDGHSYAPVTSLALVYIGIMLFTNIKKINFNDFIVVASGFIIIAMTSFTYSIVNGIGIGLIVYVLLMLAAKRHKEINSIMYIIAIFYIFSFVIDYLLIK